VTLEEAVSLVRAGSAVEFHVDRRFAGMKLFLSRGTYAPEQLLDLLAAAAGLQRRSVDGVSFLTEAAIPASVSGPEDTRLGKALGPEFEAKRNDLVRQLLPFVGVDLGFDADFFAARSGKRLLVKDLPLGQQQAIWTVHYRWLHFDRRGLKLGPAASKSLLGKVRDGSLDVAKELPYSGDEEIELVPTFVLRVTRWDRVESETGTRPEPRFQLAYEVR